MVIKKFNESCLLIEHRGIRILVDPGVVNYTDGMYDLWSNVNMILVTHKHASNCHAGVIKQIVENRNAVLYTSKDVLTTYPELKGIKVKAGDKISLNKDFNIYVVKAVHGYLPTMKENEILENLGFIIDDGTHKIYITGDSICFKNDYKCDVICMPFMGHGVSFDVYDGIIYAQNAGAKTIIPLNIEDPIYETNVELLEKQMSKKNISLKVLKVGESIEI